MTSRRGFLLGLGAALAAPAIVRAESLMKIAVLRQTAAGQTAAAVLNNLVLDDWHRYTWHQYHLGIRVVLSEITSEGLRIMDIPPEDFYGKAS